MSKWKKSISKKEKIIAEIKRRTPKIIFTAKNLIVTLIIRNQSDRWLEMSPYGQYVIK